MGAAFAAIASPAWAQDARRFEIPSQNLVAALEAFGKQGQAEIIFNRSAAEGRATPGVSGDYAPDQALALLLSGSGLKFRQVNANTFLVEAAAAPQGGSAAGGGAEVEALIVTAQKREEDIQDVPIAISAFTQEDLDEQKIEGGFDLLKAIPNVTFSKNNFTSYNFSIRGIGTKAVSATTDPGVAVAFNNTALLQNRLFEQEYFDVERVEVLRGPQGTLYGRNATAGVINVISAKPDMDDFDGFIKGEVGNYDSKRISAMINIPVFEDRFAIRFAGAMTNRQGYDFNEVTGNPVNGRDLWSARLTLGFNPTDRIRSNLIWERFEEDDDRSRTGKQLCHRDNGPETIGSTDVVAPGAHEFAALMRPALFSQGCKGGSLYEDAAFGTPNGLALPFVFAMLGVGADCGPNCTALFPLGFDRPTSDPSYRPVTLLNLQDPYGGMMQSRDLRTIASFRDPRYRAQADVVELNVDFDITDSLTFTSQTAYNKDTVYSFQDFNRFNTVDIFNDTSSLYGPPQFQPGVGWVYDAPSYWENFAPGGVFCDPQLGCSRTLAGFDISQATGTQFSQEFRLQSNFDGPLNVSVGANYTRFKALVDYYVFYNLISAFSQMVPYNGGEYNPGPDPSLCGATGFNADPGAVPILDPLSICPYVDPNPIESIDGEGHNYFRSKNPYKLKSAAAFGELYWNVSDALKVTAGLRYTDDQKTFIPVPSQVLLAPGIVAGGTVVKGYPEKPAIEQQWGEFTGRLGLDWKPELAFTDDTMLYAFYSRGYKGGGANPPTPGFASLAEVQAQAAASGMPQSLIDSFTEAEIFPILELTAVEYAPTFRPEFVNAFEAGAKNTLLGGAMTFNVGAFYYDYTDYQVSQIRDRTAVNENFDATLWGLEFETLFSPSRNLQIIANLGYLDTKIGDGMRSIDIMDRTAGNEGFVVVKPWAQLPSNCVVPVNVAENYLQNESAVFGYWTMCGGVGGLLRFFANQAPLDDATGLPYDQANYPELNGGAGFAKDISGNELPNSPHWTANIGAQYGMDFLEDWRVTVRGDAYWQSQSWARVYNSDPYDKLHGWYNVNLSIWFERPDDGLKIELYAKNLLDKTPITDAFLNSDDTALTTNVFVLDPRLIGLSIRKEF
ncbi:MAG TPA: TonB-dependent receptor [Caulobacteraceae bacterium]|nr:TonB-dependent receptor [Caulobacteraceae bacterium]